VEPVKGSLLVARKVSFDSVANTHSIEGVLNQIDVPCFPYVVSVYALCRVWDIARDARLDCAIRLISPKNDVLGYSTGFAMSNARQEPMPPGAQREIAFEPIIYGEGPHRFELMVGQTLVGEHIVTIVKRK
jgi:hypothetical protein